jgi:hypothetical protein
MGVGLRDPRHFGHFGRRWRRPTRRFRSRDPQDAAKRRFAEPGRRKDRPSNNCRSPVEEMRATKEIQRSGFESRRPFETDKEYSHR